MPIKQDRMLKLISAGQDYRQALDKLIKLIEVEQHGQMSGTQTPAEALDHIVLTAQVVFLLHTPGESQATLEIEAAYFKTNQRRNVKAAEWQARKRLRRGEGLPVLARAISTNDPHYLPRNKRLDAEIAEFDAGQKALATQSDDGDLIQAEEGQIAQEDK